ncbi:hypothetical protein BH11MYX2_BH11MYX2_12910 [soil metagenome]
MLVREQHSRIEKRPTETISIPVSVSGRWWPVIIGHVKGWVMLGTS